MRYLYLLLFLVACTPAEVHPKYKVGDCAFASYGGVVSPYRVIKIGKFSYVLKVIYLENRHVLIQMNDFDNNAVKVDCDQEFFPEEKKQ